MAEPRMNFTLKCSVCNMENYISTKNKKTNPGKFEKKKYCPRCNKHTLHVEIKK